MITTFQEWEEQRRHLEKLEDFVTYYKIHFEDMHANLEQCLIAQEELDAALKHVSRRITTFLQKMPPCLMFSNRVHVQSDQYTVPGISSVARRPADSYAYAAEYARFWGDKELRDSGVSITRVVYFTVAGPMYLPDVEEEAFFDHVEAAHRVFRYQPLFQRATWTIYK